MRGPVRRGDCRDGVLMDGWTKRGQAQEPPHLLPSIHEVMIRPMPQLLSLAIDALANPGAGRRPAEAHISQARLVQLLRDVRPRSASQAATMYQAVTLFWLATDVVATTPPRGMARSIGPGLGAAEQGKPTS